MGLIRQANFAFRQGQFDKAIRLYSDAICSYPDLAHSLDLNLNLAKKYNNKKKTHLSEYFDRENPIGQVLSCLDDISIKYKEKTINPVIRVSAQNAWQASHNHCVELLNEGGCTLSIDQLILVSRELFKIDAFIDAQTALERALRIEPGNPIALCEKATQYYYRCYSSWLMQLTEDEQDWYKFEGLSTRPDWQTACNFIEEAEKVAPRNDLRRYVQAYLLLADEFGIKQQQDKARNALMSALKALGPNKLDQDLILEIIKTVEQFRDGEETKETPYFQDLQAKIFNLPLDLLNVNDWLCFHDFFNWFGLLLCGYAAREKALALSLQQGFKIGVDKETLKVSVKAALDKGDNEIAERLLYKLKQISPDSTDVLELMGCYELMNNNLTDFFRKWPHTLSETENQLRNFFLGKKVAVVGPAPTGSPDGKDIDCSDLVVRMNYRFNTAINCNEFGSRTDVSIYNAHTVRLLNKKQGFEPLNLDFFLIRRPNYEIAKLGDIGNRFVYTKEYPGCFYKSLSATHHAQFVLESLGVRDYSVFKVNYYTTRLHHNANYRGSSKYPQDQSFLKMLQPVMANHDLIGQLNFLRSRISHLKLQSGDKLVDTLLDHRAYLKQLISLVYESALENRIASRNLTKTRKNASYSYYGLDKAVNQGDTSTILNLLGTNGSKAKAAIQYEKVWPTFETPRKLSAPSKEIAFLTVATTKFLPGLEALALGLLKLYPDMESDFYVMHNGTLSTFAQDRLKCFYHNFIFDDTDASKFDVVFTGEANHNRIGSLGYLTLEALRLRNYKQVIVLDSDLLVLNDISALWTGDCDRPRVVMDAGVRPFGVVSPYTKKTIFNSGVISLPHNFIRDNPLEKALECIKTLDMCDCILLNGYADQKFWNIFLASHEVFYLPMNYNANKALIEKFCMVQAPNVSILHFTGTKPWFKYTCVDYLAQDDIQQIKEAARKFPTCFRLWEFQIISMMCWFRKEKYLQLMNDKLSKLRNSVSGGKCLLIGNGPSLKHVELSVFNADVKVCFNWFVHHDNFDEVKPDHYILASHQFFGGWYTYDPQFPAGFLEALLGRSHKPILWVPYYFKDYIDTIHDLQDYEINYFLFEKPYKYHSDSIGFMSMSLFDFLTDNRTGILTVGVPLAVHLGVKTIDLIGCDSNYQASKDDYFYNGNLHTSKSTNSSSLVSTWALDGPGFLCYRIAARQLSELEIELRDHTKGGNLNFLNQNS